MFMDSDLVVPSETQTTTHVLEGLLILVLEGKCLRSTDLKYPPVSRDMEDVLRVTFLFSTELFPLSQLAHFTILSETFADHLQQVNAVSQCPLHIPYSNTALAHWGILILFYTVSIYFVCSLRTGTRTTFSSYLFFKITGAKNQGFPSSSAGKESTCNAGDPGSVPGSGSAGEGIGYLLKYSWASFVAQLVKNLPAMWKTLVQSLGWDDPLEKGTATPSNIFSWGIPWTV